MQCLPDRVYEIDIDAPAAEVWRALTTSAATREWYFGNSVESAWEAGSDLLYRGPDGDVDIECVIAEIRAPELFRSTFHPVWSPEVAQVPESIVEWRLADLGESTHVTITHTGVIADSTVAAETAEGWPHLLGALKAYSESMI